MASPVGNFSYAWSGAVAGSSAAGDVAFSNHSNAAGASTLADFATCALGAGQSSQYVKATGFDFYPPIPATATIRGFMFFTKGKDNAAASLAVCTEAKLIKGAAISGSNLADGQPFASNLTDNRTHPQPMIGKSGTELGGLSFTPADLTADTNFGVAMRWSATGAVTLSLDSIGMIVYWNDEPEAIIEAMAPTSGQQVGELIGAHAMHSVIGLNRPEKTRVRWELESHPVGFSLTSADPRRGADVNAVSRNWVSDVRGWVYGFKATHAGNYVFKCWLDLEDGTTLESNELTFTVIARTGTTFHVKPSTGNNGNTGLSEAQAWQTFAYALANATADATIILYDDETFVPGAATATISNKTGFYIKRSGGGAAKPKFEISAAESLISMTNCADMTFEGIDFGDNSTRLAGVTKPYIILGSGHTRLAITDCDGEAWNALLEITALNNSEFLWVVNNDLGGMFRYFVYGYGLRDRWFIVAGNTSSGNSWTAGEGWIRLSTGNGTGEYGVGANIFWNDVASTRPGGAVTYTAANPTVVTMADHALSTGASVFFSGSTGTSINGSRTVTVVDANTFTVPVNVGTPGSATLYTNPQAFVRPAWSFISVWANRVDDLLFNIAETGGGEASFQISNQFLANDITVPNNPSYVGVLGGVNQHGAIAPLFANNYAEDYLLLLPFLWDDGDSYWYTYINNTLVNATNTGDNMGVWSLFSNGGWTPWGFTFKNNLTIVSDSWGAFNFADAVSPTWISAARDVDISNNACKRNGSAAQVRFTVAGVNKVLADWNALDAVANDVHELTMVPGDLTAANNWLPDAAFTTARSSGIQIDGIFDDYVGSNRDPEAATWSLGATGGDPLANPTGLYQTEELGIASATTAEFGWTAAAGVTNHRIYLGTTYGIYTSNTDVAATTATLTGLAPSTTYYIKLVSVEDGVESSGVEAYFTTGGGSTATDGSRIYGTNGINVDFSGNQAWTNPGNVNGDAADDTTYAQNALTAAASDFIATAIPATAIDGAMVGIKLGFRASASVGPAASSSCTMYIYDSTGFVRASGSATLTGAAATDYEDDSVVLLGGTYAELKAIIEAGLPTTGSVGDSPRGLVIEAGVPAGSTTFRVHEVWIIPVIAEAGGGGSVIGSTSLGLRKAVRMTHF